MSFVPDAYAPLAAQVGFEGRGGSTPEEVAVAIAGIVEHPTPLLRWRVGPGAEALLGARASLDDEALEAAMRQMLSLQ